MADPGDRRADWRGDARSLGLASDDRVEEAEKQEEGTHGGSGDGGRRKAIGSGSTRQAADPPYPQPPLSPIFEGLCTNRPLAGGSRGVIHGMSEVIIHDDESFERALKRFKKKCEKAGILSDLRKHRHYEKPSEKKKRKMNAAQRKNRRGRSRA